MSRRRRRSYHAWHHQRGQRNPARRGTFSIRLQNTTESIAQVRSIIGLEWKAFSSGLFHTLGDAPGITFNAILGASAYRNARCLEVHNLKVETFGKTTFPGYALLTGSASLCAKVNTLFLMVFNKSDCAALPAHVGLASFPAGSAKIWQANASGLPSFEGIKEMAGGAPLKCAKTGFDYVFPAYSMTAIEISQ